MNIVSLTLSKEQLENTMASTAAETCNQLWRLGIITVDQAETFKSEWTPVLIEKTSLIEKLRKIVFKNDEDTMKIRFIKLNEVETSKLWT